jgi:hypothetical protein
MKQVQSIHPIMNCLISFDSTKVITVTMASDCEYWLQMYDLETHQECFKERFGGNPNSYIKMKNVDQDAEGKRFAVTYMDDGKFFIRTFGQEQRDIDSIESNEFDINKALKLESHTMPNDMFSDPYITSEFLTGDDLFVSLFDNKKLTH